MVKNDDGGDWYTQGSKPRKVGKLIKCSSCNKKISTLAETCPSCGAPNESEEIVEKKSNAATWSVLTFLFILFLLFHCELGIPLGWLGECY